MRLLRVLVLGLLVLPACAAEDEPDEATTTEGLTRQRSACSLTRERVLSSVSGARRRAIERGFRWLDADVPYSQSASYGGYRTDCSGFVSMCWELGQSTNTGALVGGAHNLRLRSYDELIPADALLRNGHVSIFVGWNDAAHTSACLLEESNTATDMQFRAASVASLQSRGYRPIRARKLAGDTAWSGGRDGRGQSDTSDDADSQGDDYSPPPTRPDAPDSDPGDSTCWSKTYAKDLPEMTCIYSRYDRAYEQCHEGKWYRGVSGSTGPFGRCLDPS